jgi:hypothetical protein
MILSFVNAVGLKAGATNFLILAHMHATLRLKGTANGRQS